jgi:uncharacterized protein YprB with RNaseH-like and TPR domain
MSASLGQRLRMLAGQAGASPEIVRPALGAEDPLIGQLRELRKQQPRAAVAPSPPRKRPRDADTSLAARLAGRVVRPGVVLLDAEIASANVSSVAGLPSTAAANTLHDGDIEDTAPWFLDTETTGLAGGTGTLAFMVGLARWEGGCLHIRQYLLSDFGGEPGMLTDVAQRLGAAPLVVTYNGRSFDGPLISARSRLARLGDPLVGARHLDLLPFTRRAFAHRWRDCRLATVERELLDIQRVDDLPGWAAPQAWLDWIRHGRTDELARVVTHNRQDLVSLAALLPTLARIYSGAFHAQANPVGIANWIRRHRGNASAHAHLLRQRAGLCPTGRAELARLAKQQGHWTQAVELWQELAALGRPDALENLAKYAEHRCRDPARALALTEQLIRIDGDSARHRKRQSRLHSKLQRERRFNRSDAPR